MLNVEHQRVELELKSQEAAEKLKFFCKPKAKECSHAEFHAVHIMTPDDEILWIITNFIMAMDEWNNCVYIKCYELRECAVKRTGETGI